MEIDWIKKEKGLKEDLRRRHRLGNGTRYGSQEADYTHHVLARPSIHPDISDLKRSIEDG